jgi:hypothetical protein
MLKVLADPSRVSEILEREFDTATPQAPLGQIVAIEEDGEIKAFILREMLVHVGTFWVNPQDRGTTKGTKWLKELCRYAIVSMPKGSSVVIVDDTGLYDRFLKFLGFRRLKSPVYRVDY